MALKVIDNGAIIDRRYRPTTSYWASGVYSVVTMCHVWCIVFKILDISTCFNVRDPPCNLEQSFSSVTTAQVWLTAVSASWLIRYLLLYIRLLKVCNRRNDHLFMNWKLMWPWMTLNMKLQGRSKFDWGGQTFREGQQSLVSILN